MPDPDVTETGAGAGRISDPRGPTPAIEDGQGGLVSSPLILSLIFRLNNLEGSTASNRQSVLVLSSELDVLKTRMTAAANLIETWATERVGFTIGTTDPDMVDIVEALALLRR